MTGWPAGYKLGSTIWLVRLKPRGKGVDYFECAYCGAAYSPGRLESIYDIHEIMHLLQTIRAISSSGLIDPVMVTPAKEERSD